MVDKQEAWQNDSAGLCNVICLCRGIGFPYGLAQTHRIRMVGKAAIAQGLSFTVLHIGGSPTHHNEQVSGEFEGIAYHYLPKKLDRSSNPFLRKFTNLFGTLLAVARVSKERKNTACVYAWVGRGAYGILLKCILKMIGVPVVQELNEWWPGRLEWVKNTVNLALSDGTIAISKNIESRLNVLCSKFRICNEVVRVPVLADVGDYKVSEDEPPDLSRQPYVLWCGNLEGYIADIHFMLQVLQNVTNKGVECILVLAGTSSNRFKLMLNNYIDQLALHQNVQVPGYVTDEELRRLMSGARALLLPLWDDDRSRCRFPNKIGEYLFSQRPVITCGIGEILEFLVDGETAHVCRPGDVQDFAERICRVLQNPAEAELMSSRGREQAIKWLDWRQNAENIANLFMMISSPKRGRCRDD